MDRRKFLIGSGTALAAASGLPITSRGFSYTSEDIPGYGNNSEAPQPLNTESNDLTPYAGEWTDTTLRHLLRRAMFGVPINQFYAAQSLGGMSAVVDKLLLDQPLPAKPASYVDEIVKPDPNATDKNKAGMEAGNHERIRANQISNWWFDLMIKENLSIREKMTLLWSNHFVIGTDVVSFTAFLYSYNQTLRANALGNMKAFVKAVSIDPGMLLYLNGNQNYDGVAPGGSGRKGTNINENYARELQELFTLGILDPINGMPNYTEDDVQQAAKALTGWTFTTSAPFIGQFYPASHNNDQKTYLGKTGNWGMDDIIDIIFSYMGPQGNNAPGFNAAYWFC
jgi:hypothetical protein